MADLAVRAYGKYTERLGGQESLAMRPDFPRHIAAGHVDVLETDHIIGYVIVFEEDGEMMLDNIAVYPTESGRGYGALLFDFVETRLRRNGAAIYKLYTNEVMTENRAWYPKLGFVEFGRSTVKGMNRVHFRKTL